MTNVENVVVGAGPYGLSIAAHFRAHNIETLVIGRPMASWRANMPIGMALKSETFASNLSDPLRQHTLENFYRARGLAYRPVGDPLPIETFIDYADWFRRHSVPEIRDVELQRLRPSRDGFELDLSDGSLVRTKRVILAVGHAAFQSIPSTLRALPHDLVTHTCQHRDLAKFAGKDVTIVGRGQSGLETAALLHEHGARVRILVRAPRVEWNSDPNAARSLISRLRRPEAGLGAGWYSLGISELPTMFHRLPLATRDRIFRTSWGPSGAWWLKDRVVGKIPVLTSHTISQAIEKSGKLTVTVQSAGAKSSFETDHIIAATGYKVDLGNLKFLADELRSGIKTHDGSPRLSAIFESSVPNLHFVGLASAQSFGPVMRFVYGAKHASTILARHVRPAVRLRVADSADRSSSAKPAMR
jgi:cation diffusion facilitator CzcD-associated flavoprotein CzcO